MSTTVLTGTFIRSGSIPTTALGGGVISSSTQITTALPGGTVSSSVQVKPLLPDGTVTSSAQYPGWVTSSAQIVVQNTTGIGALATTGSNTFIGNQIITGSLVLSGSALPELRVVGESVITGSLSVQGTISGNLVLPTDTVSSSTQVKAFLPGGTVTSSAQYPGWVTASSQIDYNSIQNKLSGVVSSSTQVQPLLPGGTVSSSAQVLLNTVAGTTFSNNSFYFPLNLRVDGTLTAQQINTEFVSSSIIYESGSSKFGDTTDDVMSVTGSILVLGGSISGSMVGMLSSSAQVDYNSIQNKLSGVISSSAQTVASIANQTIAPTTVNATTINASVVTASALTANQAVFTNASDGLVSNAITGTGNVVMSASPTLTGTITAQSITATGTMLLAGIVSQSSQIDYNSITNKLSGVYSSSAFSAPSQGTARLTFNGVALTDVDLGLQADDRPLFSGSQFSGIVSGSGTQYRLVVPVGTNFYAT